MDSELSLHRHRAAEDSLEQVQALIVQSFAYMQSRIDPPSSIHRATVEDLSKQCEYGEVWSLGSPVQACVCLTPQGDVLVLGRLAVAESLRGQGLGKQLIDLAFVRACALGLPFVELKVRVELTENLELYQHLGFEMTGVGTHEGFDRPTYCIMRKVV